MNIWIINNYATPPSYGGIVRHYYFSKYLTQMGHHVRIITASHIHNTAINMTENNQLITEKVIDDVNYSFVKTISYKKNNWRRVYNMVQFSINCVRAMKRIIKSGDIPDIIYTSSPSPFCCYTSLKFAKKKNFPSIFEVRDLWPLSITEYNQRLTDKNIAIKALYLMEKQMYKIADRLIFTMAGGASYIKEKKWNKVVDSKKIIQINNGIDLSEYQNNLNNYQLSDNDLEDTKTFKIIFTGSIRQIYQLETIVETAKICQKETPAVRFLLYGDGTEKQNLIDLANKYQLNNIIFKGRVENKFIPYILSKADITLLHSRQVSLNKYGISQNKLFEYLAAGKPVLSTIQSNYSLINKYNCGLECKDQEPETIFFAIKELLELPEKDMKAKGNSARLAVQKYDYSKLSEKLNNILENIV